MAGLRNIASHGAPARGSRSARGLEAVATSDATVCDDLHAVFAAPRVVQAVGLSSKVAFFAGHYPV
jgi:hypothetical protein